jgi:ribosomal protein L29
MKKHEQNQKIRNIKKDDIAKKISELKIDLLKTHVAVKTGKEKNYSKLDKIKKEIARCLTVHNNRSAAKASKRRRQ